MEGREAGRMRKPKEMEKTGNEKAAGRLGKTGAIRKVGRVEKIGKIKATSRGMGLFLAGVLLLTACAKAGESPQETPTPPGMSDVQNQNQADQTPSGESENTGQSQPGETVNTGQNQPGETVNTGQNQSGENVNTGQNQPGETTDADQTKSGETINTGQSQSGEDAGTGQAQPGGTADVSGGQAASGAELATAITTSEAVPVTEAYFPDEAFREYLLKYVDRDKDKKLSWEERAAIEGLGSVKSKGGLSDGSYLLQDKIERGEKLQAVKSMEGLEYFQNLKEIRFVGGYALEKISLNHPNLEVVYLGISTLRDFAIVDAPKLRSLCYITPEKLDIVWEELGQLSELEISGAELAMEDLAKCKNLARLSLYRCAVAMPEDAGAFDFPQLNTMRLKLCALHMPENIGTIDFARIPLLESFYYSGPKNQEIVPVGELNFGENEYLREISLGEQKIAERIVLNDMGTSFSAKADWANCEVVFAQEMSLDTRQPLPEGSVWLTAENFPDAAFRQYLYFYVDANKDHILSKEELSDVRALGNWGDNPSVSVTEQKKRETLLNKVCCFDGIEYLKDLRRLELGNESVAVSVHLDNPGLQQIILPEGLQEFSVQNAGGLQSLFFYSKWGMELDLSGMQSLRRIRVENISADFSYLLQNKYLETMYVCDCENIGETREEYDFSALKHLDYVEISLREGAKPWAERMRFGDTGYFSSDPIEWDWFRIGKGVTNKVMLESKNLHCHAAGAEVVYLDDVLPEDVVLPEDAIWNGTENIADMDVRLYLYQEIDKGRDNVLTLQEREKLTRFADTGYDYHYAPDDEVNVYKWKVEDDFLPCVYGVRSLEGFEHFPKLKELQLETMNPAEDTKTIVIRNPELEVLDLRFNGNVETIDLTACGKLRVCVIDSTRDKDFVQETKPTILLPEHLQLETIEGMDCVVGERALERFGKTKIGS